MASLSDVVAIPRCPFGRLFSCFDPGCALGNERPGEFVFPPWSWRKRGGLKGMRGRCSGIVLRVVGWMLLGAALVVFGLWMRSMMPVPIGTNRDTEIYSFDYLKHAGLLSNYHFIGYGRFRHPLFSWLMAPVALFGQRIFGAFGEAGFWVFLCIVFSSIILGCLALLFRCLRRVVGLGPWESFVCTALFMSFAHVWLLAGMPETYSVSLLLALVLLNWAFVRLRDRKLELAGWGALAVLTGGVTLTQGMKTCVAYCVVRRPTRRQIMWGVLAGVGVLAFVVLVFYIRLRIRVHFNPSARGMDGAWTELFGPLIGFSASPGEWLHHAWVFFSEPVVLRGEPFDVRVISGGYGSWIQGLLVVVLYGLAGVGAWLGRHRPLVHLIGGMFLCDVVIHLVVGWGLAESHLYAGHWFYVLPLLVGVAWAELPPRRRMAWGVVVLMLALAILVCNVHGYFGHDVGLQWPQKG